MKYVHVKGSHSSTPFTPKPWVKSVYGVGLFSNKSKYDLPVTDQGDWNKLVGISFNPIKPNQNALLLGWRYVPDLDIFQIAPYFNVNGVIFNPDQHFKKSIVNVKVNETFEFDINYYRVSIVWGDWIHTNCPAGLSRNFWTSFRVQPWFGGNQPAPKNVELYLDL